MHKIEVSGQLHDPASLPQAKVPSVSTWWAAEPVLDATEKTKISCSSRESKYSSPVVQTADSPGTRQGHSDRWGVDLVLRFVQNLEQISFRKVNSSFLSSFA
jgi:hypothetical protein